MMTGGKNCILWPKVGIRSAARVPLKQVLAGVHNPVYI